ncbi:MAG: hypothetical protein Q9M43_10690 [Sulfurimonas sp.]|nr:hypothetical protein [Sulfurimonas sp.]
MFYQRLFYDDDVELHTITRLFLQIPFEYSAMGVVGKKYEAIKDFLEWNYFDIKEWTPVIIHMGNVWVNSEKDQITI